MTKDCFNRAGKTIFDKIYVLQRVWPCSFAVNRYFSHNILSRSKNYEYIIKTLIHKVFFFSPFFFLGCNQNLSKKNIRGIQSKMYKWSIITM